MKTKWSLLKQLHNDERGVKTLEIVALLAVAAITLAVIRVFWNQIYRWAIINGADSMDGGGWERAGS